MDGFESRLRMATLMNNKMTDNLIDEICCILAERDKMIEGVMRGLVSEYDVETIVRTREETAKLLYRLIADATLQSGQYMYMRMDDARNALKNRWPELLVNAAHSIATSPFTTPKDMRELKKLLDEYAEESVE